MAYTQTPGPLGADPDARNDNGIQTVEVQSIVGASEGPEALDTRAKIVRVTRDWTDPPTPKVGVTFKIGGSTLKEALADLQTHEEWGEGGGNVSGPSGQIKLEPDDKGNYTVDLTGNFVLNLPEWTGYEKATPEQKAAWDAMIAKLRKHEQEHVRLAYVNAQQIRKTLTNLPADQASQKLQELAQALEDSQKDFDSPAKTDHAAKAWNGFPVVELDTSADPPPPPPKP